MAATPNYTRGRNLTTITIAACTEDTDGTITVGTDVSLAGVIDYIRFESDPNLEMIQSVDRTIANYVTTLEDYTVVVGEILKNKAGSWVPVLPSMAADYDLFYVEFTRGGETYGFYGRRSSFRDGVQAFGKNACELTLRSVDIGTGTGTPVAFS